MVIPVSSYKAGSSSDESERLNRDSSAAAAAQRASLSALCASHDIYNHKAHIAWSGPSSMCFRQAFDRPVRSLNGSTVPLPSAANEKADDDGPVTFDGFLRLS